MKSLGFKTIQFGKKDEITNDLNLLYNKVDWVYWGADNLFPNKFLLRLNENSFYSRVCSTQVNMVVGDGLTFEGRDARVAEMYIQELGVDINYLKKVAWDIVVLNAMSSQVILNQTGQYPARLVHVKSEKVRVDNNLDIYDEPTSYWLAKNWGVVNSNGKVDMTIKRKKRADYIPINIPRYRVGTSDEVTLIYNVEYNPAMEYYPVPPAEAAFQEIDLNVKIMDYQNATIDNGVSGSVVISYPKKLAPTAEEEEKEQDAITQGIRESLSGANKAGTALVVFYDPQGEVKPEVSSFPSDSNDKKYIETNRMIRESIFSGLGVVSEELFGIPSSTGFSSQSEMLLTANELTYTNIIKPKQQMITSVLNTILEHRGMNAEISILNSLPVSTNLTLDMVRDGVITKDEFRESLGYSSFEQNDRNLDATE
jgi:hypothetical protein